MCDVMRLVIFVDIQVRMRLLYIVHMVIDSLCSSDFTNTMRKLSWTELFIRSLWTPFHELVRQQSNPLISFPQLTTKSILHITIRGRGGIYRSGKVFMSSREPRYSTKQCNDPKSNDLVNVNYIYMRGNLYGVVHITGINRPITQLIQMKGRRRT